MATAALNAHKVYTACHNALKDVHHKAKDDNEQNILRERLGRLADLSNYVAGTTDNTGDIILTEDDYVLINGYIGV